MATDRRRRALLAMATLPVVLLLAMPVSARAAGAWWQPLALAGQRVTAVSTAPGLIVAVTASGTVVSTDGGRSFQAIADAAPASPSSARTWSIDNGVVVVARGVRDPGAPYLGAGAHVIAAPAALPGVVVAVGTDNHVWRRNAAGSWATCLVLLPPGGLGGTPQVTSLAAFDAPLTVAVYMATDGYGVLLTQDGGDDWIRADPGLPAHVLGLAADSSTRSLYAATDSGLYVHHLQSFPAPPVYRDASLAFRWLGIGLVALFATVAALFGMRRLLGP